jgi:hypothetical protein
MGRTQVFRKILKATALLALTLVALFLMAFFRETNLSTGSGLVVIVAFLAVLMTPRTANI